MLALELARKAWRTALEALSIASSAQSSIAALQNRVVSPNDYNTNIIGNIAPGAGGAIIAVVDITPKASGLLYVSGYLHADATSVGVDEVTLQSNYLPSLTGITGGTLIAPGLTTAQAAPDHGRRFGRPGRDCPDARRYPCPRRRPLRRLDDAGLFPDPGGQGPANRHHAVPHQRQRPHVHQPAALSRRHRAAVRLRPRNPASQGPNSP
jgi:hypothetical protein